MTFTSTMAASIVLVVWSYVYVRFVGNSFTVLCNLFGTIFILTSEYNIPNLDAVGAQLPGDALLGICISSMSLCFLALFIPIKCW